MKYLFSLLCILVLAGCITTTPPCADKVLSSNNVTHKTAMGFSFVMPAYWSTSSAIAKTSSIGDVEKLILLAYGGKFDEKELLYNTTNPINRILLVSVKSPLPDLAKLPMSTVRSLLGLKIASIETVENPDFKVYKLNIVDKENLPVFYFGDETVTYVLAGQDFGCSEKVVEQMVTTIRK